MRKSTTTQIVYILSLSLQFCARCIYSFQSVARRKSWNHFTVEQGNRQCIQDQHLINIQRLPNRASSIQPLLISNPTTQQQENDSLQPQNFSEDISTHTEQLPQNEEQIRKVQRIEKFARLPVWPVLNGVFIWIVGNIFGHEKAAQLENLISGRVCPNFYQYADTSPFIMLVHHCHSFHSFDPIRYVQRTFFPEGFPAHPHRGFVTITYILHGGFIHRDSEGIYQTYGEACDESKRHNNLQNDRYHGKHTQWLTTGRGMLHEEMFDIPKTFDLDQLNSRQELYQIWLNVPAKYKMVDPCSLLLGGNDETPIVYGEDGLSKTLILAGTYNGQSSIAPIVTDVALFHVTLQPGVTWKYNLPSTLYETTFIYLRQGSLHTIGPKGDNESKSDEIIIPVHNTAYFERTGGSIIAVTAGNHGVADFMFLAGAPIREPCFASGSMVMNYPSEIEDAYNDYQKGLFGIPWDYKLSNDEWKKFIQKNQARR
jgi:redox-sensitive bicupin YhaK (pirin superfamily)